MTKEISVICAARHKTNPGMDSVNAAFYFFARRHFPDLKLNFLKICNDSNSTDSGGSNFNDINSKNMLPFEYGVFQGKLEELYTSDAIIFWGDFFHMAHYRKDESRRQVKFGNIDTYEKGLEIVDKHFFLADAPDEVFRKVLIFGGNLLFNQAEDYSSHPYGVNLRRLLSKSAFVGMRDVFSAMTVRHLTNDYDRNYLSTDCAMLLKNEDVSELPMRNSSKTSTSKNKIGVFFHRNSANLSKHLKFANKLAAAAGLEAQWLDWRTNKRVNSAKRWVWSFKNLEVSQSNPELSMGDLFEMIKNYAFIVSDTYHVCVNAWNLGTPAVCIGEGISPRKMDPSCGPAETWRDKRWTFYSMFEALNYYVNVHELDNATLAKQRIKQLAESVNNKKDIETITCFMKQQSNAAENELATAIRNILDR